MPGIAWQAGPMFRVISHEASLAALGSEEGSANDLVRHLRP